MGRRYSIRRKDGTHAYYDSEVEMHADNPSPGLFDFSVLWAIVGFGVFVIMGCIVIHQLPMVGTWPRWLRFSAIVGAGVIGAYIIGRLGKSLFYAFWLSLALCILFAIGDALWHFT